MKDDKPLEVGRKIVDFGRVCRIFKIENKKNTKGERKKIIHFNHFFKSPQNLGSTYSIPIENIKKANIRRPISSKELRSLIKKLSQKTKIQESVTAIRVKGILGENSAHKTAQVLKRLWLEKNDETASFTKAKRDLLELTIGRLVEEVAFVDKISILKAREKIKESLGKLKTDK